MARKVTRDELTEHFKYLAGSINDNGLLYAVFQTARSCRIVDSTLEIDFGVSAGEILKELKRDRQ
jgi:hypothetical protein